MEMNAKNIPDSGLFYFFISWANLLALKENACVK
jgi:hypothetical protein